MKVVHYLNQFFAGLGAEDAARAEPVRIEGAVGPGRGLGLEVAATLACGDDFFAEHEDAALGLLLGWIDDERPDVLICGPAFGAGRYGYACGVLAREVSRRGFPVVAAMHEENPGVIAAEGGAYVVPTSTSVTGMREALPRMADLARRLAAGESIGSAQEEGYLPRGLRRNVFVDRPAAERAVDMLLAKLAGEPFVSEVEVAFDRVLPPPPVTDLSHARLALVSEAGCVPQGNPDRLPTRRSHMWLRYPLEGVRSLTPDRYETVHGGFDRTNGLGDPNRLVPLDVVRALEEEGRIGRVHEWFYTTTGVDTQVAAAARFGQEIATELREAGVQAVLLTGT